MGCPPLSAVSAQRVILLPARVTVMLMACRRGSVEGQPVRIGFHKNVIRLPEIPAGRRTT